MSDGYSTPIKVINTKKSNNLIENLNASQIKGSVTTTSNPRKEIINDSTVS